MTSTTSDNSHQAANSPRTELLSPSPSSPTSPQAPNHHHHHHHHSPTHRRSHTPTTPIVSPRATRQNSATERSKRERERELTHANPSHRELITLLVDQEHETSKLRHTLYTTLQRLEQETQRIASLERENQETVERFRRLNESRVTAQAEANEARQELRLVKFQLENAHQDIVRLQESLQATEVQRDEADAAAVRARNKARKLRHQRLIDVAREEGRKYGFDAGFRRAQAESTARRRAGAVAPSTDYQRRPYLNYSSRRRPPNAPESEEGEEGESSGEDINSIPITDATNGPAAQARPGVSTGNIDNQPGPERNIPSPSVDRYPVSIPPADVIERTHNNNPPQHEWVTGQQHRDINGHTPPYPTALIINGTPGRAQAPGAITTASTTPARPSKKGVKFTPSTFRRASLAKTKQTATSWYRKLSFRKQPKKKIVIDPTTEEFEEEEETQEGASAEPASSSIGPQPGPSAPSVRSQTSTVLRAQGAPPASSSTPRPSIHPTPGHSKAASMSSAIRPRDPAHTRGHKHRSASLDTSSTRTSQFELLNAPAVGQSRSGPAGSLRGSVVGSFVSGGGGGGGGGPASISGRSAKSAGAISKKLSMIKENPTSRDTTPVRPRFFEGQSGQGSVGGQFEGDGRSVRSRSSRMFAMNPDPESPEWRINAQSTSGRPPSSSALMRPGMASNSSLSLLAPVAPLRTKKSGSLIDTPTPMPKNGRPHMLSPLGRQDTTGSSANGIRIDVQSPSQSSGMPHSTPRPGPSQISPIRRGTPKIFLARGPSNDGSEGGEDGGAVQHKRSGSTIGAGYTRNNAGMTPGPALFSTLSGDGVGGGLGSELQQARLQRAGSTSSLRSQGSFGKFDPTTYVDPAIWGAPTGAFANDGESGDGHVRPTSKASSGLSYA